MRVSASRCAAVLALRRCQLWSSHEISAHLYASGSTGVLSNAASRPVSTWIESRGRISVVLGGSAKSVSKRGRLTVWRHSR